MTDLFPSNTLQVHAQAKQVVQLNTLTDISQLNLSQPLLFLGQGANVLFIHDFPGTVAKVNLKGKKVVSETADTVTLEVAAGEDWHELVMWTVNQGWSGMENMALIPGTVGAAAVGNIAAYGQSFGEIVVSVSGMDSNHNVQMLAYADCNFYYRNSIFKNELRNKFFVTSATLKLSKGAQHDLNYHGRYAYESLKTELNKIAQPPYTPLQVAQAVINQRRIKMPDWTKIGTAGSFFKNPFVSKQKYQELQKEVGELQAYPINKMLYPNPDDPVFQMADMVKIPVGRLLDELGWRGKKIGRVGTFDKHALVIINLGGATGQEIYDFAEKMKSDIKSHFDIDLEYEVQII